MRTIVTLAVASLVAFLVTASVMSVMSGSFLLAIGVGIVALAILASGVRFVPEAERHVVERFYAFHRILHPGIRWTVPIVDTIRDRISVRERVIDIPQQETLTKDDILVKVDPTLFFRVMDKDENVKQAAYGVELLLDKAMAEFAIASLRSVIGAMTFDDATDNQKEINEKVIDLMNGKEGAGAWGSEVTRHVIKEFIPPDAIMEALRKKVTADKERDALVITSDAQRQAAINVAEGQKQATIKAAQAEQEAQIARAEGEAKALERIAEAISKPNGEQAVSLRIAHEAVAQFGELAKASTNTVVPLAVGDIAGMVATLKGILPAAKKS